METLIYVVIGVSIFIFSGYIGFAAGKEAGRKEGITESFNIMTTLVEEFAKHQTTENGVDNE